MTAPCCVEDCSTPSVSWKMCQKHYKRVKVYGTTDGSPMLSAEYRFNSKIDKSGECWLWTAALDDCGYGHFRFEQTMHPAHRIAYELANGSIPDGMEVDHMCRTRSCVRPEHLRLATRKQNMENLSQLASKTESKLRGVTRTSRGRWCARVGHNKRMIHIGVYATMEEAAAAVVAKRLELHTYNHADRIAA